MILLDTHALLWSLDGDERLTEKARQAVSEGDPFISIVSLWEMAVKTSLVREERRLTLDRSILEFADLCRLLGIGILPITPSDCEQVTRLPHIHEDPFDRMIIAQAATRHIPVVTKDENIWKYPEIEKIW